MNLDDAEDQESVAAHIAGMQREMLKASPSYHYLMDSMSRTYAERRLWISREIPSVADVVEKHPALTNTIVSIHIDLFSNGIATCSYVWYACLACSRPDPVAASWAHLNI